MSDVLRRRRLTAEKLVPVRRRLGTLERRFPNPYEQDDEPTRVGRLNPETAGAALGVLWESLGDGFETWIRERGSGDESVSAVLALVPRPSEEEPPDVESDDDAAFGGGLRVVTNRPSVDPILRTAQPKTEEAMSPRRGCQEP